MSRYVELGTPGVYRQGRADGEDTLLVVVQYTTPTKDELLKYIAGGFEEVKRGKVRKGGSWLEMKLSYLPFTVEYCVKQEDALLNIIDSIAEENTSRMYLQTKCGTLPSVDVKHLRGGTGEVYNLALDEYASENEDENPRTIILLSDGMLPPRRTMNILLEAEVTNSSFLSTINVDNYGDVRRVVRKVYREAENLGWIPSLSDISAPLLDQMATHYLHNAVMTFIQQRERPRMPALIGLFGIVPPADA